MSEKKIDTGGYTFPLTDTTEGMTLRDYFAAKAMVGYVSMSHSSEESKDKYTVNNGWLNHEQIAKDSYALADAMIKERKKQIT